MAEITRYIKHRRDTAANWTSNNPILKAGQLGIETDGLTTTPKFKIGDGVTAWTSLPYFWGSATKTGTGSVVFGTDPTFTSTNSGTIKFGDTTTNFPALWFQNASPSATNYTLACDDTDNQINSLGSTQIRFNNTPAVNVTNQALAVYSSSFDFFKLTKPSYTVPTITEHRSFRLISDGRTWANGGGSQTLATQRECLFEGATYTTSGGGSLTITNAYNAWFGKATGSGVTITNNWAAGFDGNIYVNGNVSATTVNKLTLTAPANGSTLTIADGKTLTANNSLTLAGTDSTTMTFPSISSTVAGLQDVYFTINNFCGLGTFTASTTFFVGGVVNVATARSTNAAVATQIPYNCTLVGATIITWHNGGTNPSQTNSTVYFRLNDTTDVTLSSAVLWNTSNQVANNINVTGLSTSISANDSYSVKIVMGALATAPSTATISVILYFARR